MVPAAGFGKGTSAYHVPNRMVEGRGTPVDLWITAGGSAPDLKAQLEAFLVDNADAHMRTTGKVADPSAFPTTQVIAQQIDVARKMYAELSGGANFDVDPKGPIEQVLRDDRKLTWSWIVTPKAASGEGGFPLELKVMADPGDGRTALPVIRRTVIVEARARTWSEKVREFDAWLELLTGGGVATMLAFLYRWRSRRPDDDGSEEDAPGGVRLG